MNAKEMVKALSGHGFLTGLPSGQIQTLSQLARLQTYSAGSWLLREGQPADAFHLLHLGRVAVELHSPEKGVLRIQTLGPGDVVGWSWLLPPYRWHFDVRALEAAHAYSLNAEALRQACEADHDLGFELLKRLLGVVSGRLSATRLQLLDVFK